VVHLDLPGISGFPSVSDDEKTLFFSHYLNDTNHDQVIDGNDNSVVFRTTMTKISNDKRIFPEQLTSAESNCSFPRPYQNQLYVTCALDGYLGVYQIPQTGIVPPDWTEPLLMSAHQTSRSYEDRILVLNTIKFRLPNQDQNRLEERILSNDLLADDTTAAKYYLTNLKASAAPERHHFYDLLEIYLNALELKKAQATEEEIGPSFQAEILKLDAKLQRVAGQPRFKTILRGLLKTFLVQPSQSATFLREVKFSTKADPLERYYYFELASWTLPRVKSREGMADVYREMMTAPELSLESKIYYTSTFLQSEKELKPNRADRLAFLDKFNHDLPEKVSQLLKSETVVLRLIEGTTLTEKAKSYAELNTLMLATQTDYFLRKALYVRAILNFAEAVEFNYLSLVANNWLRYTANQDTEYSYAREVFVNANLDQAYAAFGQKNWHLASDFFYGSLSMTDDLESHFGYLISMVKWGQRATIDLRYQNLRERHVVEDSMKYVEAILRLIDKTDAQGRVDGDSLEFALQKLGGMENDRDSPVRYLLLGYCNLQKLTKSADSYDFDRDLFEQAHRSFMLAYDIGRDNDRVRASSLMNLGLLHQRVQNHSLAVQFFAKRKQLGFVASEDRADFAWFYARSLFYAHQPDKAAEELGEALNLSSSLPGSYLIPLTERRAFYLQQSESFAETAKLYHSLLEKNQIAGDLNLAKVQLSYGYVLSKLKRDREAQSALRQSLVHAENLNVIPKGGDRLVDFQPLRLKLDAYGFLGKLGSDYERIEAMEKRVALLPLAKGFYDDEASLEIQSRLQLAELYSRTNPSFAAREMREALNLADQLAASGQPLSHAVFQATVGYLAHGIVHPDLYREDSPARAHDSVEKTIHVYGSQRNAQPMLEYQKLKLQLLWSVYSSKVLGSGRPELDEIKEIMATSTVESPELDRLAEALIRSK
jgi:cellulose synthase operon protein C